MKRDWFILYQFICFYNKLVFSFLLPEASHTHTPARLQHKTFMTNSKHDGWYGNLDGVNIDAFFNVGTYVCVRVRHDFVIDYPEVL
jgi:hypothetical protein